jgi:hypothetical protein
LQKEEEQDIEEIILNLDESIFVYTPIGSTFGRTTKIPYEKVFFSSNYSNILNTTKLVPTNVLNTTKLVLIKIIPIKIISEISGRHKYFYLRSDQRIYKLNKTEEMIKDIIE